MIICKQPEVGGAVNTHCDSTFLYTTPLSALGFWFALEPCTISNGCLSFVPGSHRTNVVDARLERVEGGGTKIVGIEGMEGSGVDWEKEEWKVEECGVGDLVLIHGSVIHRSEANKSSRSRFIYTVSSLACVRGRGADEGCGVVSYD
jgi:phytanoyl-CoA hydroxylase